MYFRFPVPAIKSCFLHHRFFSEGFFYTPSLSINGLFILIFPSSPFDPSSQNRCVSSSSSSSSSSSCCWRIYSSLIVSVKEAKKKSVSSSSSCFNPSWPMPFRGFSVFAQLLCGTGSLFASNSTQISFNHQIKPAWGNRSVYLSRRKLGLIL